VAGAEVRRGGAAAPGQGRGAPSRARSRCRAAPPLVMFLPSPRAYSGPLFLKRQCDQTPGGRGGARSGARGPAAAQLSGTSRGVSLIVSTPRSEHVLHGAFGRARRAPRSQNRRSPARAVRRWDKVAGRAARRIQHCWRAHHLRVLIAKHGPGPPGAKCLIICALSYSPPYKPPYKQEHRGVIRQRKSFDGGHGPGPPGAATRPW
jgi:hypothetical protein